MTLAMFGERDLRLRNNIRYGDMIEDQERQGFDKRTGREGVANELQ